MKDENEILDVWGGPDCPIDSTLELIGRKWVIAIIRDMFVGKKHFSEFKKNKPNLNNSVLSDTLKFMEEKDLVEKIIVDNNKRSNTEYHLTSKSRRLNTIIYDMVLYGLDEIGCCSEDENLQKDMKTIYHELLFS